MFQKNPKYKKIYSGAGGVASKYEALTQYHQKKKKKIYSEKSAKKENNITSSFLPLSQCLPPLLAMDSWFLIYFHEFKNDNFDCHLQSYTSFNSQIYFNIHY
jgi:hypothetical protein